MRCGAVIPAAGNSTRLGLGDKTMLELAGRPVLAWVLQALIESNAVDEIVIVVSDINQFPVLDLITETPPTVNISTVNGAGTRMESVRAGVRALSAACDLVLIHDAARPLVPVSLIRSIVECGSEHGAVIPGVAVSDTVKRVEGDQVVHTLDRRELIAVQTPQVFRLDWLRDSYGAFDLTHQATDEAAILEAAGFPVRVIPGDPANIKVTNPSDVVIAEALLGARRSAT